MTKSTITRERAQQIFLGNGPEPSASEERELARMALAAMGSEPVAWLRNPDQGFHLPMLRLGSKDPNPNFVNEEFYPVYAAPQPEPVVPDENTLRIQGIEALEEFLTATTVEPEMLGGIKLTLACCRALKAIIKNKGWADFNDGKPEKVKAETIITALSEPHSDACRAAMLAAAPQSPGSEPATVPGKWIPVSERMPEDRAQVILWDAEIGEVTSGHYSHKTQTFYHCGDAIENEITHWMPPPCAPQEVKGE
ncbi:DUF551 domain-containing protein [Klebsiella pneumoniae]